MGEKCINISICKYRQLFHCLCYTSARNASAIVDNLSRRKKKKPTPKKMIISPYSEVTPRVLWEIHRADEETKENIEVVSSRSLGIK